MTNLFVCRGVPANQDNNRSPCPHCKATKAGRNLIITLDGTSNQFGQYNTNVIELYDRVIKDKKQLTYYNSGIGTYARPSFASFTYWKQVLDNAIDLAIAWNFEKIVLGAYRWLSDNYEPALTCACYTGFSRGAYQVRALAGMIHKVGLILRGNEEQIPFAYELYADLKGRRMDQEAGLDMADRFKRTFSQKEAAMHFLGAWDTVSSIGIVRSKSLPATEDLKHTCYFRHALALDERRVKFLPEYVCGGDTDITNTVRKHGPHIKEVWFSGCHSDIKENTELNNAAIPVLWMGREAMAAGLRLNSSKVVWDWTELLSSKPTESLTWAWRLFEVLPFKRLSYKGRQDETWRPHLCKGRTIKKGQKIHASVAFIRNYRPRATLSDGLPIKRWDELLERGKIDGVNWAKGLEDLLEIDMFDFSTPRPFGDSTGTRAIVLPTAISPLLLRLVSLALSIKCDG
ncbi:hypothetical protein BV22DRAFT_1021384 [Leucogyrophana mollusca]|uniref:Uncharacterized protein n=1 Tax=Leucogyrophana mollusca TaxID=85980 RepID=A0ACB8B519_9AGAM|nr:hypothetical protein BV22DRAFT_1021384 [Leucogyrophana mollusca]